MPIAVQSYPKSDIYSGPQSDIKMLIMTKILKRMITRIKFMISITIGSDKLGKGVGGSFDLKMLVP